MLSRPFTDALGSPAEIGMTSWLLFVMFNCDFVTFPCGILGQVSHLIVSIPDLFPFSYFGVLMHHGMAECHLPFGGHSDRDLDFT